MGTRNLTAVFIDGEYKVAQYGQWDGDPSGQGATILQFLHDMQQEGFESEFKNKLKSCRFMDHRELESLYGEGKPALPEHISRDAGGEILSMIVQSENGLALKNSLSFAGDSLFCEYAYVLDFDKGTFEVYEGFNKTPLSELERFHGTKREDNEYHPVKLRATFSLNNPPTEEAFLEELTEQEEVE